MTKRYGGHGGIADVSLDVARSESVVIVGPRGLGKTRLLRLIAGPERPDSGEIWLDGRKVAGPKRNLVAANERRVGFVFQDLALWPHLTVRGNLAFVAESAASRESSAADESTSSSTTPALGGEQQRVALPSALVVSPRLLLLDEPFPSLDPELRPKLRGDLASFRRRQEITAIYVTHDRDDAAALSDRTVTTEEILTTRPCG